MNMFEVSKEKNWKSISQSVFIVFGLISLVFFFIMHSVFTDPQADHKMATNVGIFWTCMLLLWLGCRWRYRLIKKNKSNKIK